MTIQENIELLFYVVVLITSCYTFVLKWSHNSSPILEFILKIWGKSSSIFMLFYAGIEICKILQLI